MLHMQDDRKEKYSQLEESSVIISDEDDGASDLMTSPEKTMGDSVLSPTRAGKLKMKDKSHTINMIEEKRLGPRSSLYDDELRVKRPRKRRDNIDDNRFRVNGIVVDQEIRGGPKPGWEPIYQILFQSSTPHGQQMALWILIFVSISVSCAVLDSVEEIREVIGDFLLALEIFFTTVFTIEYSLRVVCLRLPLEFILSLLGLIDICALVPTYLGFFIPSARPLIHLAVLRIFRVLRVFRVLRLARFVDAGAALSDNIQANKRRILVFLIALFTMILVIGCAMYLVEGDRHSFSNIPISLYWTVVTVTTVGYGDIAPHTVPGRMLATVVMFAGYGIIACPLVLSHNSGIENLTELVECPRCYRRLHQEDANFCRVCGTALRQPRVKSIKAKIRRERLQQLRTPIKTTPASAAIPIPNSVTSAEETVDMIEEVHSHQLR